MNRIIIFEGCDRTGKSTCIEMLSNTLKEKGFHTFIFHLMGPNHFGDILFTNDEKSLIQLSKFDDQYYLFDDILKADSKNIIILDRSHFGEYVWTRYWDRIGKYTDLLFNNIFNDKHSEIFKEILYIHYYVSDISILEKRIKESELDLSIFSNNENSVIENINYVYDLFGELEEKYVKPIIKTYIKFDNIGSLEDVQKFVNQLITIIR